MSCKIRKGPLVAVSVLIRLIYLLCFFTTRPTESVTIQPFRIQQINTTSHFKAILHFPKRGWLTVLLNSNEQRMVWQSNEIKAAKGMQLLWEEVPRTYTAQVWNCHGCKHDLFHRFVSQGCSRIPTHKNQITTTTTTTAEGRWTDNWDGQIQLKQWGFSRAPSLLWCDIVSQWNSNEHLYLQILRDRQHLVLSYLRLRTSLAAFLLFSHEGVNYVWGIGAIS